VHARIDAERKTNYTNPMRQIIAIAATLAFLGACSSGGGCDGSDGKSSSSSGQSSGGGGGGGGGGIHGTGEQVSFQGLGKNPAPPPANGQAKPAPGTNAAAYALGGSQGTPAQTVICGGFPNMPADCSKDPAFDAIKQKCCPTGQVDQCQGIPGGARLIGHSCTATVK
jgi:hypothetical protein